MELIEGFLNGHAGIHSLLLDACQFRAERSQLGVYRGLHVGVEDAALLELLVLDIDDDDGELDDLLGLELLGAFSTGALEIIHADVVERGLIDVSTLLEIDDTSKVLRGDATIGEPLTEDNLVGGQVEGQFVGTIDGLRHVEFDNNFTAAAHP